MEERRFDTLWDLARTGHRLRVLCLRCDVEEVLSAVMVLVLEKGTADTPLPIDGLRCFECPCCGMADEVVVLTTKRDDHVERSCAGFYPPVRVKRGGEVLPDEGALALFRMMGEIYSDP